MRCKCTKTVILSEEDGWGLLQKEVGCQVFVLWTGHSRRCSAIVISSEAFGKCALHILKLNISVVAADEQQQQQLRPIRTVQSLPVESSPSSAEPPLRHSNSTLSGE